MAHQGYKIGYLTGFTKLFSNFFSPSRVPDIPGPPRAAIIIRAYIVGSFPQSLHSAERIQRGWKGANPLSSTVYFIRLSRKNPYFWRNKMIIFSLSFLWINYESVSNTLMWKIFTVVHRHSWFSRKKHAVERLFFACCSLVRFNIESKIWKLLSLVSFPRAESNFETWSSASAAHFLPAL